MMHQGEDGQWYEDEATPSGGAPPPTTGPQNPSSAGFGDPGNTWNAIQGMYSKYLGRNASQAELDALAGQPLSLIENNIANSPEARKYAGRGATDTVAGGEGDWQGLQQSIFGSMPEVPNAPPFEYDPWSSPAPFSYAPWTAPTAEQVAREDPGFQFRVGQGRQAMEQSAAARGVLNTGGTLQDLVDYGQKAGSQEYGNAFNRSLGTYQTNRNNAFGNYGMNYNNALNSYVTNFGGALTKYNTNYGTQYANPYNMQMQQYGNRMQGQNQLFNQQFQTATA